MIKRNFLNYSKQFFFCTLLATSTTLHADCNSELLNISTPAGMSIDDFVDQISDACSLSVVVKDKEAGRILNNKLHRTKIQDATLPEVLDTIIKENGLFYRLDGNLLKISYLITKTFHVDYVNSKRTGKAITDASVDVGSATVVGGTGAQPQQQQGEGDTNRIESEEQFDFWDGIQEEIGKIVNRPGDNYAATEAIVNSEAGLITITATQKQIKRVENYLKTLEARLHQEVLLDVKIFGVQLSEGYNYGIDWSQFNLTLNQTYDPITGAITGHQPVSTYTKAGIGETVSNIASKSASTVFIDSALNMTGMIDFLKKSGDVFTLSSPKVLTLNNQQALISVGSNLNYNSPTAVVIGNGSDTGTQSYQPSAIFVGILLNITPEITKTGEVILRINPSVSELLDQTAAQRVGDSGFREIAPDTKENKLSTVVKVKDGSTVIMGGLISNNATYKETGVPLLKDIPLLGYAFKNREKISDRYELVFVVTPHIVSPTGYDRFSLEDLGFNAMEKNEEATQTLQGKYRANIPSLVDDNGSDVVKNTGSVIKIDDLENVNQVSQMEEIAIEENPTEQAKTTEESFETNIVLSSSSEVSSESSIQESSVQESSTQESSSQSSEEEFIYVETEQSSDSSEPQSSVEEELGVHTEESSSSSSSSSSDRNEALKNSILMM